MRERLCGALRNADINLCFVVAIGVSKCITPHTRVKVTTEGHYVSADVTSVTPSSSALRHSLARTDASVSLIFTTAEQ